MNSGDRDRKIWFCLIWRRLIYIAFHSVVSSNIVKNKTPDPLQKTSCWFITSSRSSHCWSAVTWTCCDLRSRLEPLSLKAWIWCLDISHADARWISLLHIHTGTIHDFWLMSACSLQTLRPSWIKTDMWRLQHYSNPTNKEKDPSCKNDRCTQCDMKDTGDGESYCQTFNLFSTEC